MKKYIPHETDSLNIYDAYGTKQTPKLHGFSCLLVVAIMYILGSSCFGFRFASLPKTVGSEDGRNPCLRSGQTWYDYDDVFGRRCRVQSMFDSLYFCFREQPHLSPLVFPLRRGLCTHNLESPLTIVSTTGV